MGYNRLRTYIIALVFLLVSLSGCKDVRDIRITSVRLETISFQGLTSLGVHFAVDIDNPAMQVGLEEIHGEVRHSGKVIGKIAVDPFIMNARSAETYHLRAVVSLAEGATLKDLAMLMDKSALDECTVDISARPRLKNGLSAPVTINDSPLKKLLEKVTNEK